MLPHSRRTRVTSRTTGSSNGMTDSKRPSLSILQGFRCTYVLGKIPFTARFFVEKPLYQPGIVENPHSLPVKSRSKIYQMIYLWIIERFVCVCVCVSLIFFPSVDIIPNSSPSSQDAVSSRFLMSSSLPLTLNERETCHARSVYRLLWKGKKKKKEKRCYQISYPRTPPEFARFLRFPRPVHSACPLASYTQL